MTAASRREELEAIIWRTRVVDQHAVIGILAAADRYKEAAVGETVKRLTDRQLAALGRAEAEKYGETA